MREYGLPGFRHAVVTPGRDGPWPQADVTVRTCSMLVILNPFLKHSKLLGDVEVHNKGTGHARTRAGKHWIE